MQTLDFGSFYELLERADEDSILALKTFPEFRNFFKKYYELKIFNVYGYVNGTDDIFYTLEENPRSINQLLMKAVSEKDDSLLDFCITNDITDVEALKKACWGGNDKAAIKLIDSGQYLLRDYGEYCLRWASSFGYETIVDRLLEVPRIVVKEEAIRGAVIGRHSSIVSKLLKKNNNLSESDRNSLIKRAIDKKDFRTASILR